MQRGFSASYILIGVVILACVAVAAYYLGRSTKSTLLNYPSSTPDDSMIVKDKPVFSSPTSQTVVQNEKGWMVHSNKDCNVEFLTPPKEPPYYYPYNPKRSPSVTGDEGSGRYWRFTEQSSSVYKPEYLMDKFYITTMFAADDEASGFIAGEVSLSCAPNDKGYDNNSLLTDYKKYLVLQQLDYKDNSKIKLWGKEVVKVSTSSSNFGQFDNYIFATPKHIYKIEKRAMSPTELVQQTTDRIFDQLKFSD